MTRLLPLAAALLAAASLRAIADDTAPAKPAPNGVARAQNEAADPNTARPTDEPKPTSSDPNKTSASNNTQEPSPDSPAPKPKPETPAERTARLTKIFRYEINGDTRRILDTTFQYSKKIAQLEADYDKSLSDERYADSEKIALELVPMLPRGVQVFTLGGTHTADFAALAKSWTFEAELCHRAHLGEFGNGPDRRRGVSLARLQKVCEMVEALKPDDAEIGSVLSLGTLLLRAVKIAEQQSVDVEDEFTRTVNLALDRVKVELPSPKADVPAGTDLGNIYFSDSVSLKLKDTPDDALLIIDVHNRSEDHRFTIKRLVAEKPIRRSQLGNAAIGYAIQRKASDAALLDRVHSTLARLFPSETIEVHVVRGDTVVLRASLKHETHEQQIVSIAQHLTATVLNQMSVSQGEADPTATVEEKLDPIGVDERGLREVLARLYPKEHIEAHVLPISSAVVLRGHLSRPEYAQQVYDIAQTSYGSVLYQMTPPLPTKPRAGMPGQTKATTPRAGSSDGGLKDESGNRMTMVWRLTHAGADVAARELQQKFSGNAIAVADVQTNSLIVSAEPAVFDEIKTAVATLDVKEAKGVASTAPADAQETAMDREARQLATKFRTAKLDEQPALRRQLEQLTERHFEQRQERRQREIDDLGQRLDKLRVTHHRRQENKTAVIQQRVQDLLDPNADLRWDEPRTNEVSKTDDSTRGTP